MKNNKKNPPEPPPMAPDSIYYELYTRLIAAYQQWCMDELKDKEFMVDLNKIQYKVGEAANNILEGIKADFSLTDEKGEKKNVSRIITQ
jgi:hypothetical protein